MELQRITILLQKYFETETNLDEENELITYFNSEEVDEKLKSYIPMFSGLKTLSSSGNRDIEDDLMNFILESEHKEKLRYRWMGQIVTGVAAAVILALLVLNHYSKQRKWNDTFANPDQAYAVASKTLDYVAGKYCMGLAQLEPIGKIEDAVIPLNSGMSTLNSGFSQLEKVELFNKKLKNE